MWDRCNLSLQDSDAAGFFDLMCLGELITKTTVLGLVAALHADKERHQYAFHHRLVRADGIGEWDQVLQQLLTGSAPPADGSPEGAEGTYDACRPELVAERGRHSTS